MQFLNINFLLIFWSWGSL